MLRALVGPTASGKTETSIEVAEALGAEIVSVDSMLVYRGMDIGTAKPTRAQRAAVPHHLLDLAEPSERFTVARFQRAAGDVLPGVGTPLLAGGSGLYFRAVADALRFPPEDPAIRAALEALLASEQVDPVRATDRAQVRESILAALDYLPAPYGDILEWKYLRDLSMGEIARRLGRSPKAVESLLTRAREAFRETFSLLSGGEAGSEPT